MEDNNAFEPTSKKQKTSDEHEEINGTELKNGANVQKTRIRIGSRKSQLALFQANFVAQLLREKHPEIFYEIKTMMTTGDNILNVPLSKIGEKSLFTKELEIALDNNEVDVIVHSLKDLPTSLPPGMVIGGICRRENPYDAVVLSSKNKDLKSLEFLPKGSIVGTSSLRRIAQLRRNYPNLVFKSVRGNLNTRLRKLEEDGTYDALILAVAGLERMDVGHRISAVLQPSVCLYAVGQGALAIECKAKDGFILNLLSEISDKMTILQCICERAFMKTLEGGCSAPVAVCSAINDNKLKLEGGVFSLDGTKALIHEIEVPISDQLQKPKLNKTAEYCGIVANSVPENQLQIAEKLGIDLAQKMLEKGAHEILTEARAQNAESTI